MADSRPASALEPPLGNFCLVLPRVPAQQLGFLGSRWGPKVPLCRQWPGDSGAHRHWGPLGCRSVALGPRRPPPPSQIACLSAAEKSHQCPQNATPFPPSYSLCAVSTPRLWWGVKTRMLDPSMGSEGVKTRMLDHLYDLQMSPPHLGPSSRLCQHQRKQS